MFILVEFQRRVITHCCADILKRGIFGKGRFPESSSTHEVGHLRLPLGMQGHKVTVHQPALTVTAATATTGDMANVGGGQTDRLIADNLIKCAKDLVNGEAVGLYHLSLFQDIPYPQLAVGPGTLVDGTAAF